jgi:hypothetical protein
MPSNALMTLYQKIKIGETNSVADLFWHQIYLLEYFKDQVDCHKGQSFDDLEFNSYDGIDIGVIKQKIYKILTEFREYDEEEFMDAKSIEAVTKKVKSRISNEVTDQLWDIMKCEYLYLYFKNPILI